MVKVVVTGGMGFLGMEVVKRLLRRGTAFSPVSKTVKDITNVTIFDSAPASAAPAGVQSDARVRFVQGSVTKPGWA
eukprot:CAMPEP_0206054084 /NCGR_PEP_ID=MMETSP1466-20131121/37223_1 /ASSEMBLY_ACC=CAM_ASM_001126 /TAXON_ID=44452 /ORGANISM="Pavlova gyrans, Strain CCMP608" /LENGTH=75 /DNA_ID=CAMNT_0053429277 /DNA_START=9 /DNA_END=233 /DNA_ORIENTATION=-